MGPVIFAFGPDERYLISNGSWNWWSDLPEQLGEAIGPEARNVHEFLACSFGKNDQHFVTFRQRGGKITQRRHQLPPKLNVWLYKDSRYTRNLETLRVVLGPNDSFFAMDKNGLRWDKLPDRLEAHIQENMTMEGWKAAPRAVALGVDSSFVLVDWKGKIHCDLKGRYEDLERYLSTPNLGRDIEYISLDAFRGKFYFVKKKGGRRYWTGPNLEKVMSEFVRQLVDSTATAPPTIESLRGEKRKLEMRLVIESKAFETRLASETRALESQLSILKSQYQELQASHKDVNARLKTLRKDFIERKREWKEQTDVQTKESAAVKTVATNVAARAITVTNEVAAHDATLKQQLQAALQTAEALGKSMAGLSANFVELMDTLAGKAR